MIIKPDNMTVVENKEMRGGKGTISITMMEAAENMKHCRLMSRIVIPVGGSIGNHDHVNETEYYIIVSGQGLVDDNGKDTQVGAGDLVVTGDGAAHDIRNTGTIPLEFYAVIVTDAE